MAGSFAKLVALVVMLFLMAVSIGALVFMNWVRAKKIYPKPPLDQL